ncbi:MAG: hypothetical protein ABIY55_09220, partial [Kofleriaceae bacterium]
MTLIVGADGGVGLGAAGTAGAVDAPATGGGCALATLFETHHSEALATSARPDPDMCARSLTRRGSRASPCRSTLPCAVDPASLPRDDRCVLAIDLTGKHALVAGVADERSLG